MNATELTQLIEILDEDVLNTLLDGNALLLEDDVTLLRGDIKAPNVFVAPGQFSASDAEHLRRELIGNAGQLLEDYYRVHPLTRYGFDTQAGLLIQQFGHAAFIAVEGHWPQRTLFVEQGTVIAEDQASPRHRYGVYCELPKSMDADAASSTLEKWLASGEAYEQYLGANVCRYNC